jgi:hypothetical protein
MELLASAARKSATDLMVNFILRPALITRRVRFVRMAIVKELLGDGAIAPVVLARINQKLYLRAHQWLQYDLRQLIRQTSRAISLLRLSSQPTFSWWLR